MILRLLRIIYLSGSRRELSLSYKQIQSLLQFGSGSGNNASGVNSLEFFIIIIKSLPSLNMISIAIFPN